MRSLDSNQLKMPKIVRPVWLKETPYFLERRTTCLKVGLVTIVVSSMALGRERIQLRVPMKVSAGAVEEVFVISDCFLLGVYEKSLIEWAVLPSWRDNVTTVYIGISITGNSLTIYSTLISSHTVFIYYSCHVVTHSR